MACSPACKWICIIAYILAAIGAILCMMNHIRTKKIDIPKPLAIAYGIGGIVTLTCALTWAFKKEQKN
jgi:hypothetical protein